LYSFNLPQIINFNVLKKAAKPLSSAVFIHKELQFFVSLFLIFISFNFIDMPVALKQAVITITVTIVMTNAVPTIITPLLCLLVS
jgi:hypothetical protein